MSGDNNNNGDSQVQTLAVSRHMDRLYLNGTVLNAADARACLAVGIYARIGDVLVDVDVSGVPTLVSKAVDSGSLTLK